MKITNIYSYCFAIVATSVLVTACQPAKPQAEQTKIQTLNADDIDIITGIGRVEPENKIIKLNSEVGGLVTAIRAKEGTKLTDGQVIIELSHGVEDSRISQAQSRVPTQKASVQDAEAAIAAAAARVESSRSRVQLSIVRRDAAKVRLDRMKAVVAKGADTQQNLDNAQSEYDAAAQEVRTAESEVAAASKDVTRQDAAARTAKSRITEAEADVKVAQSQQSQRFVRAPYGGTLLSMDITPGANIAPGTSIGDFAPSGNIVATCEIDELFATRVQVGQKAYIRNQGMTDTLSVGTVIYAAPYLKKKSLFSADAGELEDRRVREVRIRLDKPEKTLLGARVDCVIKLK